MRIASAGLLTLVCLLSAGPAAGQDYEGAIGYGGGGAWFGSFDGGGGLALDPGWLATVQAEHWTMARGRVGVRGTASFTQRPLQIADDARRINTWLFDGSLLFRPLAVDPDRLVSPFLGVGAGVVSYGLGEGIEIEIEDTDAVYPGNTDRRLSAVGSVGLDVLPRLSLFGTRLAFRLEGSDHVALESPFARADGEAFGPVHNVRFTLGVLGLVELP